jgi:peptidoglycan/xylan/chitin deacetylase (PgdA/CDA1 family)
MITLMIPVEQYTIGAAEMENTVLKACFFVMTVSVTNLTKEQIAALSDTGNVIAAHTWDHHRVTKYTERLDTQLIKPKAKLEEITGRP